jgi:VanZ family protein
VRVPWRVIPALAWAGLIFWLSSQTHLPSAIFLFAGIDKLFHAVTYGILALLLLWALPRTARRPALLAMALASAYGVSDELHQALVPGRSPDVVDWLADTAGAALALGWWRVRGGTGSASPRCE